MLEPARYQIHICVYAKRIMMHFSKIYTLYLNQHYYTRTRNALTDTHPAAAMGYA